MESSSEVITMMHGSGGSATDKLIEEIFEKEFRNDILSSMEDAALVDVGAIGKIAMTTDSFVVDPIFFKGGDIGRLCICGTVNDLLMRGAKAKYITCGFILEEGLKIDTLKKVVASMAACAREAGVEIVAGDTKVVNGKGGMYINTAGVGIFDTELNICASNAQLGDSVLITGNIGDHHAAILSDRMGIENDIESDNAPLCDIVGNLLNEGLNIHVLRDVTRGGLATILTELSQASKVNIELEEEKIPVSPTVKSFAGLLGLDPLYMGNEGKAVVFLPEDEADRALEIIRKSKYGEKAQLIGKVVEKDETGKLLMRTSIGTKRQLQRLVGEGLPRIC